MDGYLVVLRHTSDDYPAALFATWKEAIAFANEMDWEPSEHLRRMFNGCGGSPCAIFIVEIRGGQPADREIVRRFDALTDEEME